MRVSGTNAYPNQTKRTFAIEIYPRHYKCWHYSSSKPKKNVGLRNVPPIIEPNIILNRVTVTASRRPKNISVTRVITLASPNLIHGEGRGMSIQVGVEPPQEQLSMKE
jgi:hypothetical protein